MIKQVIVNNYILGQIKNRCPNTECKKLSNNSHQITVNTDNSMLMYLLMSFEPVKKQLTK